MVVKIEEPRKDQADLSDWHKILSRTTFQGGGFIVFDYSNKQNSNIPQILAGSRFEFNSAFYRLEQNETILNWSGISNGWCYAYLRLRNDGNAEFYWSNNKPVFNVAKGGWFHSSNNERAIMFCYKLSDTTCRNKAKMSSIDNVDAVYPVGAIFEHTWDMNPQNWMLDTIWERFGDGKVLVGVSTETEFNSVEKTGGSKTQALTTANLPSHSHSHSHDIKRVRTISGSGNSGQGIGLDTVTTGMSGQAENYYESGYTKSDATSAGSGTAHNNLQPYITVYRYKRTA